MIEPAFDMATAAPEIQALLSQIPGLRSGSCVCSTPKTLSTGIVALDHLLDGGLPAGQLTEAVFSRGERASFLLALASAASQAGLAIAWIDPGRSLDARTAADAGLDLARILSIHPDSWDDALRIVDRILAADGFGLTIVDLAGPRSARAHRPGPCTIQRQHGRRLIMDSSLWNRLAKRTERSGSSLVLCSDRIRAGGAAALGLEIRLIQPQWAGGGPSPMTLEGASLEITVLHRKKGAAGQRIAVPCAT
ncbi:MAG: hypothetical protein KGR26_04660 [Cyanobacteria bacterium REEB65]|nr:hypothetical protein [Cyanobacteria bacterium REEB65]